MFYLNFACKRYKDPHGFNEGLVWANVGTIFRVVYNGISLELGSGLSS